MRSWRCSVLVVTVLLASWAGAGSVRHEPYMTATPARAATSTTSSTSTSTTEPVTQPSATTTPPPVVAPPPVTRESSPLPAPEGYATVMSRGDGSLPVVALTFDAGADAGHAAEILDTLRANAAVASFGITGQWAQQNPDLVLRIVHEGHVLINHTYDHASFTGLSSRHAALTPEARRAEIDEADAAISAITGATTKPWFRPPYGDYNTAINGELFGAGYLYNVMWTVDSLGWRKLSAQQITDRCLIRATAGAIYLFHVGSDSGDAAALQPIIDGLRASGYGFVTVAGLVG